ncbi:MAG: hypothetical protein ABIN74_06345 [Ferruginibacter sp.]
MIEQTDLIVSKWEYHPPLNSIPEEKLTNRISLEVMKKRTATKKGIACRFTCEFVFEENMILEYVAADSYVIDLADLIDKNELHTMIRNSYTKFNEKFDFRKLGTVLQDRSLVPFDEKMYELEPVLLLLNS